MMVLAYVGPCGSRYVVDIRSAGAYVMSRGRDMCATQTMTMVVVE